MYVCVCVCVAFPSLFGVRVHLCACVYVCWFVCACLFLLSVCVCYDLYISTNGRCVFVYVCWEVEGGGGGYVHKMKQQK